MINIDGRHIFVEILHDEIELASLAELIARFEDQLAKPSTERQWQSYGEDGQRRLLEGIALKRLLQDVDGIILVADSQWEKLEDNVRSLQDIEEILKKQELSLEEIELLRTRLSTSAHETPGRIASTARSCSATMCSKSRRCSSFGGPITIVRSSSEW